MYLTRLTLEQFRSYSHLDLPLAPGLTLVVGDNATGKSNLLEAVYTLAALRSPRATTDGELIAWHAPSPPIARVAGHAQRSDGPLEVEIAIAARRDARGAMRPGRSGAPLSSKRVRVNGIPRRAADAAGALAAVLFTTLDIDILTGSPSVRRRFLDDAIVRTDRAAARAQPRYEKVLGQRNALLRRIGDGTASRGELGPWDDVLVQEGSVLLAARLEAVAALREAAARHHAALTNDAAPTALGEGATLDLRYAPALAEVALPAAPDAAALAGTLRRALTAVQVREVGAGTTLVGPHRDDLQVLLDGRTIGVYGSRAQQRTAALALRLAEADLVRARTGETPVLLLDDVFSEFDPARRESAARAVAPAEQVLLTTADPAALPGGLPAAVGVYRIAAGRLVRV